VRYTALLLPGHEPGVYVAFVPALDLVTQGEGIEGAIQAAREAATLAVRGLVRDGEEVPVEPAGGIVAGIEVAVPAEATAVA
jgi:predicted RNase H-like HicB family nuclease